MYRTVVEYKMQYFPLQCSEIDVDKMHKMQITSKVPQYCTTNKNIRMY